MITAIKKPITAILLLSCLLIGCGMKKSSLEDELIKKAETYIADQNYEKAIEVLEKVIVARPQQVKTYYLLGDLYYFQSNLVLYRMGVLNVVMKYGKKIHWATPKEVDFATPEEGLLQKGMDYYKKVLALIAAGQKIEQPDPSYLHYELGWGYMAMDYLDEAEKEFSLSYVNGKDMWDTKRALVYLEYLKRKQQKENEAKKTSY